MAFLSRQSRAVTLCVCALFFVTTICSVWAIDVPAALSVHEPVIRVLLGSCDSQDVREWQATFSGGAILIDGRNSSKRITLRADNLRLHARGGALFLNDKKLILPVVIIKSVDDNGFRLNGVSYAGMLLCVQESGCVHMINCVGLEDYVAGVLSAESWPGWPQKVNEVLATVIRTYGLKMIDEANKRGSVYHVKNTNSHQVYSGVAIAPAIQEAVQLTRGQVLVDAQNDCPILAMYDTCCGGIVPARMSGVDFQKAPYLARKKACTFCAPCKRYAWSLVCGKSDFGDTLKKSFPHLGSVREVRVHARDKAGLVTSVLVKGSRHSYLLSGKKMRSLFKGIKSCCFLIDMRNGKIVIKGRGNGHQLGLCQWGAYMRVQKGWSVERVLQFYYPGVLIRTLPYADERS